MTKKTVLGHSHYHPLDHDWAILFTPGACETCGSLVSEGNSLKIRMQDAKRVGLIRWTRDVPEEEWYDEDEGCCRCPSCPDPVHPQADEPDSVYADYLRQLADDIGGETGKDLKEAARRIENLLAECQRAHLKVRRVTVALED